MLPNWTPSNKAIRRAAAGKRERRIMANIGEEPCASRGSADVRQTRCRAALGPGSKSVPGGEKRKAGMARGEAIRSPATASCPLDQDQCLILPAGPTLGIE